MSFDISVDIYYDDYYCGVYIDGVLLQEGKHLEAETLYRTFDALPNYSTPRIHCVDELNVDWGEGFPRTMDELPEEVRNAGRGY